LTRRPPGRVAAPPSRPYMGTSRLSDGSHCVRAGHSGFGRPALNLAPLSDDTPLRAEPFRVSLVVQGKARPLPRPLWPPPRPCLIQVDVLAASTPLRGVGYALTRLRAPTRGRYRGSGRAGGQEAS
jgi:hypothetical protein